MRVSQVKAVLAIGIGLACAGASGAQEIPARRIGLGLDFAGSVTAAASRGNYLGPTAGVELGNRGPLRLRADASLQLDIGTEVFANTNVADLGGAPVESDARLLKALATATIAAEVGTRRVETGSGLFAGARVGGGAGRWGAGLVQYRLSPTKKFSYREPGYTAAVTTAGAEVGLWFQVSGRPHRLAARLDGVQARDFSTTRLAIVLLRH